MTQPRLEATIERTRATGGSWDVVVVGAGLAGSMAALGLARAGASTLLLDRAGFPRWKVCGCCLSAHAAHALASAGFADLLIGLRARRIDRVSIHAGSRALEAPLAPTCVVSREALDAALVLAAIGAGAEFLPSTRVRLVGDSRVECARDGEVFEVGARAIVLATGLHDAPTYPGGRRRALLSRTSHVGLGATGDPRAAPDLPPHLTMALTAHGYVGFVHLEDGRLNAAAALSPALLKRAGSPAGAVGWVLDEAGLTGIDPSMLAWRGTPPLTRARSREQQGSLFAVGDAARFVEPVTGEGMSWALAAGKAVVEHVLARVEDEGAPETWPADHRRLLRGSHLRCTLVSRAMRHPVVMSTFMRTMRTLPAARDRAIRALIGASPKTPEPAE